jgi:hypothetical protein
MTFELMRVGCCGLDGTWRVRSLSRPAPRAVIPSLERRALRAVMVNPVDPDGERLRHLLIATDSFAPGG